MIKWLLGVPLTLAVGMLSPTGLMAQDRTGPSPAAPMDLSRPQFDTVTPLFNVTGSRQRQADLVVAEIDGRSITLGQVADAIRDLPPEVKKDSFETLFPTVLSRLVQHEALVIRAQRLGLDTDAEVKRRMTVAAEDVLVNELLSRETTTSVTEKMLLDRYDRDIAGKPGPDEVHVKIIIVPSEQEATAAIAEIGRGGEFAKIAQRISKDPSAGKGGDLGYLSRDKLTPDIAAVAFGMPPGQVVPNPIKTDFGWCVLKVEERRQGATPSFPAVREQLLLTMRREQISAVLKEAMAGVTVHEYSMKGKQEGGQPEK